MEKARKIIWIFIFVGILTNGAALLFPEVPQKQKQFHAVLALFNSFYCYWSYDRAWKIKEEKKEK